jgi:predicted transcriptional regulator
MTTTKARRCYLEIVAEILMLCRRPTAKTRVMNGAYLSFSALQKFLKHLQRLELLRVDEISKRFVTTEKGLELLRNYVLLQKLLESSDPSRGFIAKSPILEIVK